MTYHWIGFDKKSFQLRPFKTGIAKMYFGAIARHQGAELLKVHLP